MNEPLVLEASPGERKITLTKELLEAVRRRHGNYGGTPERWAFLEELRFGTGWGDGAEQRIDAWAMALWASKTYQRIAYELKVSRADFLHEIKSPLKRRRALTISNQFYFVVPEGLVNIEEVPLDSGLIEVYYSKAGTLATRITVEAIWRDTPPPPWRFFAAILRRVIRDKVGP